MIFNVFTGVCLASGPRSVPRGEHLFSGTRSFLGVPRGLWSQVHPEGYSQSCHCSCLKSCPRSRQGVPSCPGWGVPSPGWGTPPPSHNVEAPILTRIGYPPMALPPPPSQNRGSPQNRRASASLLRGGRYASCGSAGGLSCFSISGMTFCFIFDVVSYGNNTYICYFTAVPVPKKFNHKPPRLDILRFQSSEGWLLKKVAI